MTCESSFRKMVLWWLFFVLIQICVSEISTWRNLLEKQWWTQLSISVLFHIAGFTSNYRQVRSPSHIHVLLMWITIVFSNRSDTVWSWGDSTLYHRRPLMRSEWGGCWHRRRTSSLLVVNCDNKDKRFFWIKYCTVVLMIKMTTDHKDVGNSGDLTYSLTQLN